MASSKWKLFGVRQYWHIFSAFQDQAQEQGWSKANKLEGRATAHGLIGVQVDPNSAVMVELNCETDFVARNKQFLSLLQTITDMNLSAAKDVSLASNEVSINNLDKTALDSLQQPDGKNLADLVALNIGQIGENLSLSRGAHFTVPKENSNLTVIGFTHPSGDVHKLSYGRYGVLLALEKIPNAIHPSDLNIEVLGQQLCQHVVGMNPESVGNLDDPNSWPKAQDKKSVEKAEVEDNPDNPYGDYDTSVSEDDFGSSEKEMIHQPFIFDTDRLVRDILLDSGLNIKGFVRYEVGQAN